MASKKINDNIISSVELLKPLPWFLRWDVFPFFVLYSSISAFCLYSEDKQQKYAALSSLGVMLALHLVVFLASRWSLSFRCRLGCSQVSKVSQATNIMAVAAKNTGSNKFIPVTHTNSTDNSTSISVANSTFSEPTSHFDFQKISYSYDKEQDTFSLVPYPVSGLLSDYLYKCSGYVEDNIISKAVNIWGKNEFDIPLPSFMDFYSEHLVAPFFVFQVLCLVLWSLDDYWYYSVLTLLMLMFFEGMQCKQRLNSLQMLRNMLQAPFPLYVYRHNKWEALWSNELLPGDVISMTTQHSFVTRRSYTNAASSVSEQTAVTKMPSRQDEWVVPCDVVLLRGGCVTNEAMLTGESVPQTKESVVSIPNIAKTADTLRLNLTNNTLSKERVSDETSSTAEELDCRRHVVYGGTIVVQHSEVLQSELEINEAGQAKIAGSYNIPPPPPDHGCIAAVLRTGYGTSQGNLMRKILFASERISVYNMETVYFIGILVFFALIASCVVLYYGIGDKNRNQFKLFLHCAMIVTSVVPPELPMELSLAVTNSLVALSKGLIYCTEPFRIPFAGKLDILCFDKTGTLTKDRMVLRGVVEPPVVAAAAAGTSSSAKAATPPHMFSFYAPGARPVISQEDVEDAEDEDEEDDIGLENCSITTARTDPRAPIKAFSQPSDCGDITLAILGTCHSLVVFPTTNKEGAVTGNKLSGDPLELATMSLSGCSPDAEFKQPSALNLVKHDKSKCRMQIVQKYPFSSGLKRMSVLVVSMQAQPNLASSSSGPAPVPMIDYHVFTKGAPEVLASKLADVPEYYHQTYLYHMSRGKRVLALAYRHLVTTPVSQSSQQFQAEIRKKTRDSMEKDLVFAGFLIFDCALKPDTKSVVRELKQSNHRVMMITGDSVYTAADVAKKVRMLHHSKVVVDQDGEEAGDGKEGLDEDADRILVLETSGSAKCGVVWRKLSKSLQNLSESGDGNCVSTANDKDIVFDPAAVETLSAKFNLCVIGVALDRLLEENGVGTSSPTTDMAKHSSDDSELRANSMASMLPMLAKVCPYVSVFARVSPSHKELILQSLNHSGMFSLMCGDGTNDVGALKAAHIGISIINDVEFEDAVENKAKLDTPKAAKDSKSSKKGKKTKTSKTTMSKNNRASRAMAEQSAQEQDPTIIKLGDASIASPFTSRRTSIDAVLTVIRQGRCTLVATIQVFKILALNCLTAAYMMSVLYLQGLKQGDTQMTIMGFGTTSLFFLVSQAKPLVRLSPQRPPNNVFHPAVVSSIVGQFLVHLISLLACLALCNSAMYGNVWGAVETFENMAVEEDMDLDIAAINAAPDKKFQPSLINSSIYLLTGIIQVNNFIINYRGYPFTQELKNNKELWRTALGFYILLFILVGGTFEPLNDLFQLVQFPSSQFQAFLLGIMLFNGGGAFLAEQMSRRFE